MRIHTVALLALFVVACSSPQVSVGRPPAPLVGTDWRLFQLHDLPTIGGPYQSPHATFRIDSPWLKSTLICSCIRALFLSLAMAGTTAMAGFGCASRSAAKGRT